MVRHPIFVRVYQRLSRSMERDTGEHRDELLAGLSGHVRSWIHTSPHVLAVARAPGEAEPSPA